jgi:hypothetical protein
MKTVKKSFEATAYLMIVLIQEADKLDFKISQKKSDDKNLEEEIERKKLDLKIKTQELINELQLSLLRIEGC